MRWIVALLLSAVPLAAHPDPGHTLAEINQHLKVTPNHAGLLFRKAELLLQTGHPAEATPVVAAALQQSPDSPKLLLLDARLAERLGQRDGAAAMTAKLVRRFPKEADAWGMHARLLHEEDRADEAISAKLRQLEFEAATNAGDYLTCAGWLRERAKPGDLEKAITVMDRAIVRFGCLTGLQEVAIGLECALGRHVEALRRVDLLVKKFRPSAHFSILRADIFGAAGRYREAASACDSAIALMGMHHRGYDAAGQIEKLADRKAEFLKRASSAN